MALIAAISEDGGLEAYLIHPRAISTPEFVAFVKLLSDKFGGQEFSMFMDNLQVHKTQEVEQICTERKIQRIFNVPYSPDFNGIESYFSLLKCEYKKRILKLLIKGIKHDSKALILHSLENIEKVKVQKCVECGLKSMFLKA